MMSKANKEGIKSYQDHLSNKIFKIGNMTDTYLDRIEYIFAL